MNVLFVLNLVISISHLYWCYFNIIIGVWTRKSYQTSAKISCDNCQTSTELRFCPHFCARDFGYLPHPICHICLAVIDCEDVEVCASCEQFGCDRHGHLCDYTYDTEYYCEHCLVQDVEVIFCPCCLDNYNGDIVCFGDHYKSKLGR